MKFKKYEIKNGNCAVLALSIALKKSYEEMESIALETTSSLIGELVVARKKPLRIRKLLTQKQKKFKTGMLAVVSERILKNFGWKKMECNCWLHEIPNQDTYLCQCSMHLCTIVDGTLHDFWFPTRKRKVSHYFINVRTPFHR